MMEARLPSEPHPLTDESGTGGHVQHPQLIPGHGTVLGESGEQSFGGEPRPGQHLVREGLQDNRSVLSATFVRLLLPGSGKILR